VRHVEQTVTVVDGERREVVDCTGETAGWGARYLAGTLFDQEHVFAVSESASMRRSTPVASIPGPRRVDGRPE
jgi:hypothetical protein